MTARISAMIWIGVVSGMMKVYWVPLGLHLWASPLRFVSPSSQSYSNSQNEWISNFNSGPWEKSVYHTHAKCQGGWYTRDQSCQYLGTFASSPCSKIRTDLIDRFYCVSRRIRIWLCGQRPLRLSLTNNIHRKVFVDAWCNISTRWYAWRVFLPLIQTKSSSAKSIL